MRERCGSEGEMGRGRVKGPYKVERLDALVKSLWNRAFVSEQVIEGPVILDDWVGNSETRDKRMEGC